MMLSTAQAYDLLAKHGVYALEACERCGAILGALRFMRTGDTGVWCSRECRGDGERPAIRKGGRPRKYESDAEEQRPYRSRVLGVAKPPLQLARNKALADAKSGSLDYPHTGSIRGGRFVVECSSRQAQALTVSRPNALRTTI